MSDMPPLRTTQLLKQYGLWATKSLGQNFLDDPHALQEIAAAARITRDDVVLEIGSGLGSLTRHLAAEAREVVAVELDRRFFPVLRRVLKAYSNVRLIQGDILQLSPGELQLPDRYLVAANIPYHITSAVLRHLLSSDPKPRRMVVTVQAEVATRICAAPPNMSLLALSVQVFGQPQVVARIPAEAFVPAPQVDSAVVRVEMHEHPQISSELLPAFFDVARAGFSQKRKMLRNALSGKLGIPPAYATALLKSAGVSPQRRAETLSLMEWESISREWSQRGKKDS